MKRSASRMELKRAKSQPWLEFEATGLSAPERLGAPHLGYRRSRQAQ